MNIYCLDDDIKFLDEISKKIIEFSVKENIDIHIISSTIVPKKIPQNINAFFLDIEINNSTSLDFAMKIRKIDKNIPIIFITNHDCYVYDSIKLHIFDFVRKKYFDKEIESILSRLVYHVYMHKPIINIKMNNQIIKLKTQDIIYIEAFSHNCVIHLIHFSYPINKGVKDILKDQQHFLLKIHKSYHVNLFHIIALQNNYCILYDGNKLPIGRKYKQKVYMEFNKL